MKIFCRPPRKTWSENESQFATAVETSYRYLLLAYCGVLLISVFVPVFRHQNLSRRRTKGGRKLCRSDYHIDVEVDEYYEGFDRHRRHLIAALITLGRILFFLCPHLSLLLPMDAV